MRQFAACLIAAALLGAPAAACAAERMVTTAPGVEIHVVDVGPKNALAPLVLVPGWTMPASIWSEQVSRFGKARRVIALDPRSQGASTKTATDNTPDARARDIKAVLDQAGAERVVLVGWSQGVQDVAGFVNQFGTARLAGVVLVDSAISEGAAGVAANPQAASRPLRMLDIYARAPEDYLRGMLDAIIVTPQGKAKIDGLVAEGMKTPPATGVAMLVADLFGADRSGAAAKLDVPVLVVTSSRALDLEAQKAMAAKIPGARQETVADAGHAVFVDQPEKFDALLAGFLEALG
jgi:microsomal epoxide hydrolase